ncbi:MAG: RdgB/HAM1 family non-canonical purine NTP pyrophosphatase [Verrucomicrobiota bacterium]|nr:RdgB/HAM1 family non-canonical purine NTP pyrophosphatase [Verrucomicrobiota bacterium]
MIPLLLATRNAHKTAEFTKILGGEFAVTDLSSRSELPEVEESGETFGENALLKALAVSGVVSTLVVADDSGLEVDALEGRPGVYSARYAGEGATDERNVAKLLEELRGVAPSLRTGRFRCALALAREGKTLATFLGSVEGVIADWPRGKNGFGYDPVFVPVAFEQTFAELGEAVKNTISHRANTIRQLRRWLTDPSEKKTP